MSKIPVTIVDNFLKNPDDIRKYALELDYAKGDGKWPGTRSKFLEKINADLSKQIASQIFSLFVDLRIHEFGWDIESCFQLIPGNYEIGLVHNDLSVENWDIAGVIYLNPEAPLDAGTSIHRINPSVDVTKINPDELLELKKKFYQGVEIDTNKYREMRDLYNSTFEKTAEVGNIYNRLVVYSTSEFHQANKYFGTTPDNSRLTYVFFAKFENPDWVKFPLDRVIDVRGDINGQG